MGEEGVMWSSSIVMPGSSRHPRRRSFGGPLLVRDGGSRHEAGMTERVW